ncbi:winged helix-turn-helix domain-containing protein [Martelella alba]|uniref:Winged helix-turn-helix domain-containing protein n=1 Tax=Martelella alba TaxID=2590451 RepID=A0ABY2SGI1_9HYPH|nr:winged helix-turn-helix domain-containing protein [Martelella alba]TKI03558.1 winged helix-turn-helix domain-containing protein [Martelella alba]
MKIPAEKLRKIIYQLVSENDGITNNEIILKLGMSATTIQVTTKQMTDDGFLFRSGSVKEYHHHITNDHEPPKPSGRIDIFTEYRETSKIYQFDKRLREVRKNYDAMA